MHKMLLAEDLASSTKATVNVVKAAYDDAIYEVRMIGLQHHLALANELAGEFLISRSEQITATPYLDQAVKFYCEWGAIAKVHDLQSRHPENVLLRTLSYLALKSKDKSCKTCESSQTSFTTSFTSHTKDQFSEDPFV
jgi:hypothetical protein